MEEQKESLTLESVKKMSDEELRLVVAEVHGWEIVKSYSTSGVYGYWKTQPSYDKAELPPMAVPNYPHDLNAVHEVRKNLSTAQWYDYVEFLCGKKWSESWSFDDVCSMLNASARLHCEALVLCLSPDLQKHQD